MVRNLEERLGVRLAERTTRSIAPTAAGERLLERVRPVLDEYQSALESTNEFRGRSSRPIPWKTPHRRHRDLESRKTVGSTVLTV
jgi:DNA-binding transcriptional LysR family regulator